jgi:hypothetical protein
MDNGELVIVPGAVRCGDVICILSETVSACALRSDPDRSWSLVSGDCYLITTKFHPSGAERSFMCDDYVVRNQSKVQEFRLQ